jgi:uncharacterized protein YeaO (DUF488 family)
MRHRRHAGRPSRYRYREELRATPASAALVELHRLVRAGPVTLLFAARDQVRNSAVVLKAVLEEMS